MGAARVRLDDEEDMAREANRIDELDGSLMFVKAKYWERRG